MCINNKSCRVLSEKSSIESNPISSKRWTKAALVGTNTVRWNWASVSSTSVWPSAFTPSQNVLNGPVVHKISSVWSKNATYVLWWDYYGICESYYCSVCQSFIRTNCLTQWRLRALVTFEHLAPNCTGLRSGGHDSLDRIVLWPRDGIIGKTPIVVWCTNLDDEWSKGQACSPKPQSGSNMEKIHGLKHDDASRVPYEFVFLIY